MQETDAPARRPELQLTFQTEGDRNDVVIADPTSGRHFRMGEVEGAILGLLDGQRTLAEAYTDLMREYPGIKLSVGTVVKFAERLATLGLLAGTEVAAPKPTAFRRLMSVQLRLANPDRQFEALRGVVGFLYRPANLAAAAALVAVALILFLCGTDEFARYGRPRGTLGGLVLMWVGFTLISVFHECGHGLTCRYFGGKTYGVGFFLIYGIPAFYCDVSGAWTLGSRRQRIWINLAGLGWQFVFGAFAFLAWRCLDPDTLGAKVLHSMAAFSGVLALLNLNPLIKLDGYYLLCDWLNIPNLRKKALEYLGARCRQSLFGFDSPALSAPPARRRLYFWFGFGAALYTTCLLLLLAWIAARWLVGHWAGTGALVFLLLLGAVMLRPLRTLMKGIGTVFQQRARVPLGKRLRLALVLGLFVAGGVLFWTARWPLTVTSPCQLEATERVAVRPKVPGVLADIRYREGERVAQGAVLGALDTFDLERRRTQVQTDAEIARIERQMVAETVPLVRAERDKDVVQAQQQVRAAQADVDDRSDVFPLRRAEAESRVREARAGWDAAEQVADRRRGDERSIANGDLTPKMRAIQERIAQVAAQRELAVKDLQRAEYLVSEGALERRRVEVARAALTSLQQEEKAHQAEMLALHKDLVEQREDAEALVRQRRASYETALDAQRQVEAETQPRRIEVARANVQTQQATLQTAKTLTRAADVKRREVGVKALNTRRAAVEAARLEQKIRQARITAPVSGVISTARVEEKVGKRFDEGETICWIDRTERLRARIQVDEKEIGELRKGQDVRVKVGAYPDRWFDATVQRIAPRAVARGNRNTYEVEITIPNPKGELRPGLSGYAKVACGDRPLREVLFRRINRYLRTEVWTWF